MKLSTKQVFILLSILMRIGPCLTYASYGAFLARTLGLDPLLTNMVNQAFYIGMVLLEVPTGAVADKYGKRISYLVYCFFYAAGSLVYFFSHNFLMAAFSEFILALGSTFQSGSFSSWAEEGMRLEGTTEQERHKARTTTEVAGRFVSITCGVLGGFLFTINPHLMWLASSLFMAVTGLVAYLVMRERPLTKDHNEQHEHEGSLSTIIKTGFNFLKSSQTTRNLFFQSALFNFCIQAFNMQWQETLKIEAGGISRLYFFLQISFLVGVLLVRRMKKFSAGILNMINAGTGLFLALAGLLPIEYATIAFILHEIPRGMILPMQQTLVHGKIESGMPRSTILSFESMMSFFGGLLGLSFSGLVAKYFSYEASWFLSGFILLILSYWLSLFNKKE